MDENLKAAIKECLAVVETNIGTPGEEKSIHACDPDEKIGPMFVGMQIIWNQLAPQIGEKRLFYDGKMFVSRTT